MSKKLNFGPMDEKCFISRSELLQWINNLLQVSVTKVEQLGSGNIYSQLFDVIYPGKIPLNKLKWKAKHEYEFTHNFKLLQKGFDSVQVAKTIPIEKLIKVKYQDNLEFAQWMKRFFELNCKEKGKGYDAKKRRNFQEPDLSFCGGGVLPQYTMIYGNFKDMEREIAKQDQEEEEEEECLPETGPNLKITGTIKDQNINKDKENINQNNISKLEPSLQKQQKTNKETKLNQSVINNQQTNQIENLSLQKSSSFNPQIAAQLLKKQNSSIDRTQQNSQIQQENNADCPFFMNNNQVNKYPTLNFQNSSNNVSLLKQLENKETSDINKTPSYSDKIFKESDSIMNSGCSTQNVSSPDTKSSTTKKYNDKYQNKLRQIKLLIENESIDNNTSQIDHLIHILTQIKSIVN